MNTIRFYESIGILPLPSRSSGGRRTYSNEDVKRLTFIKHCRSFGFSVASVRDLLALKSGEAHSCEAVAQLSRTFRDELDKKVVKLQDLRNELTQMIEGCSGGPISNCAILAQLEASGPVDRD